MPSLAHEGNPKEAEIVISGGSVLSTAQLDIDFQFFAGDVNPTVPSTYDPGLTQRVQSCPDVFQWTGMQDGVDIMYLFQNVASGSSIDRYNDQTLDLTVHSSPDCYGVVSQKYWPLNFANNDSWGPALVVWDIEFSGVISGTPRAGIALDVLDDLTDPDNVQLFGAVIDMDIDANGNYTGVIQGCRWVNQSLSDFPTILFTITTMPNKTDVIRIQLNQDASDVGNNSFGITLYDSVFATRDSGSVNIEAVNNVIGQRTRHNKMRAGFVAVGGQAPGVMKFKRVLGNYLTASPYLESWQTL
jgi:hypothetical protein